MFVSTFSFKIFHSLIVVQLLFCQLEKGLPPKKMHVLCCHVNLAFILTFHVFGSCFRKLVVILVSGFVFVLYYIKLAFLLTFYKFVCLFVFVQCCKQMWPVNKCYK